MESELLDRLNRQLDTVLQVLHETRARVQQLEQELAECREHKDQTAAHAHNLQEQINFEHSELEGMVNRINGALEHNQEGQHYEHPQENYG